MTSSSEQSDAETRAIILQMVAKIANIPNPRTVSAIVTDMIAGLAEPMQRQIACSVGLANPLFIPDDAYAAQIWPGKEIGIVEFSDVVLRMKKAVQKVTAPRILLACPRKSASTFVSAVLVNALGTQETLLSMPITTLQNAGALGAAMREHELDELAILRACFMPTGFVAQQHVRCTPYLAQQLGLYGIKPVLMKRNLLDSLISLDEMCMEAAQDHQVEQFYFFTHLPKNYKEMDPDMRMSALIRLYLPWYINFYASWRKAEAQGKVFPLWISYENDVKGPPAQLASKLAGFIGGPATPEKIEAAIVQKTGRADLKFNKGVVGRGQAVSEANRAIVRDYVEMFRDGVDFSDIMD
jgi:hypothetical protein